MIIDEMRPETWFDVSIFYAPEQLEHLSRVEKENYELYKERILEANEIVDFLIAGEWEDDSLPCIAARVNLDTGKELLLSFWWLVTTKNIYKIEANPQKYGKKFLDDLKSLVS